MLYMIVNRTRTNLTAADYEQLGALAQAFYTNIPSGVRILGDWAATDGACTFALVEVPHPGVLEQVQAPFRPYVDMESVAVQPVTGWQADA